MTMEFYTRPGAFTFNDLRAVFGEWHRSPPEPDEAAFALACFVRHDVRSGAPFSLYAEHEEYSATIDPERTPKRVYFQPVDGRWD